MNLLLYVKMLQTHLGWKEIETINFAKERHPTAIVLGPVVQHEVVGSKLLLLQGCQLTDVVGFGGV